MDTAEYEAAYLDLAEMKEAKSPACMLSSRVCPHRARKTQVSARGAMMAELGQRSTGGVIYYDRVIAAGQAWT